MIGTDIRTCKRQTYIKVRDTYSFKGVKTSLLDRDFDLTPEVHYYINNLNYKINLFDINDRLLYLGFIGISPPSNISIDHTIAWKYFLALSGMS